MRECAYYYKILQVQFNKSDCLGVILSFKATTFSELASPSLSLSTNRSLFPDAWQVL